MDVHNGEFTAFKLLAAQWLEFTTGAAMAMVRNREQAKEIGACVMENVWKNRHELSENTLMKTYLVMKVYEEVKARKNKLGSN